MVSTRASLVEDYAKGQYGTATTNLDKRVAIHSFGSNPQSWAEFVRERLPLRPGDLVLDVGAGTGLHWQTRLPDTVSLVLLDRHAPMCKVLADLPHGQVLQGDAQALPLASRTFDLVTSFHVLYHVEEQANALTEMLRVARPGAWLAIATNGPRHMRDLDDLAALAGLRVRPSSHLRFSLDDAEQALSKLGLDPIRHDYPDELRVPRPEPILDYLDSVGEAISTQGRARAADAVTTVIGESGYFRIAKETGLILAKTPA